MAGVFNIMALIVGVAMASVIVTSSYIVAIIQQFATGFVNALGAAKH